MSREVDLYNSAYRNDQEELHCEVRAETYGRDFGQTSWVSNAESGEIPKALGLSAASSVLEIGCGSGRYALHLGETTGCRLLGLDINPAAVARADQLAAARNLAERLRFQALDASQPLPLADASFDAAFANDALCHIPRRLGLLGELFRVLRPGARLLFSDALVIGGMVTHEELAIRSSIGTYVFSPPGENERLIERAGFRLIAATDTTTSAAAIAQRWHDARAKRAAGLIAIEGQANFDGLQRFLSCVRTLSGERRLLRFLYLAQKEA